MLAHMIWYINMVDINRKTCKTNGVETIVDSDKIIWLNEKHVEKRLEERIVAIIKREYLSKYRKHRYKFKKTPKQSIS